MFLHRRQTTCGAPWAASDTTNTNTNPECSLAYYTIHTERNTHTHNTSEAVDIYSSSMHKHAAPARGHTAMGAHGDTHTHIYMPARMPAHLFKNERPSLRDRALRGVFRTLDAGMRAGLLPGARLRVRARVGAPAQGA